MRLAVERNSQFLVHPILIFRKPIRANNDEVREKRKHCRIRPIEVTQTGTVAFVKNALEHAATF